MFNHEGEICTLGPGGNMRPEWIRISDRRFRPIQDVSRKRKKREEVETNKDTIEAGIDV